MTVDAFRRGEPAAVRAVFDRYSRLMFAVAMGVLRDRATAEDATQQAMLQAWRAARNFDSDRDLGPWLATITKRAAIDMYRHESTRAHHSLDDPDGPEIRFSAATGMLDDAYERWTVREAVDELPEEERTVVRLQHLEGFTHSEIAKHLDIPLGTVKSRSARAHRRLAGRLGYLREAAS